MILQDLLNTTKQLISYKTTHDRQDEIHAICSFVCDFFRHTSLQVTMLEHNGFPSVVVTKGTKTPKVFLSGHLDVVPGSNDQFEPKMQGDRLYGRGALDMKSGNAVMMHLMRDLAQTSHDVGLMLTSDEEIGGFDGTGWLLAQGYRSQVAIIPDGGEAIHNMISKEKGILRVKLTAHGIAAHGSTPWLGRNAIECLLPVISKVLNAFDIRAVQLPNAWVSTVNLGTIHGGDATNQVPDKAMAEFDIRFVETDDPHELIHTFQYLLSEDVEMEATILAQAVSVPLDHPLVVPFANCVTMHGRNVNFTLDHGASDGRFFSELGIPVIISQPDGANLHAPDEWVHIPSIELYYHVLKEYLDNVSRL